MKKTTAIIFAVGLVLAILITNGIALIRDGRRLEQLRGSVLRLHILAESDSPEDQQLKLRVRDALLESGIFEEARSLEDAEETALENIRRIEETAEKTLREQGCGLPVSASIADVEFDERVYGDITMPAGEYRALQVKIGSAQGHNWWCVMYPPLCLPAAEEFTESSGESKCESEPSLDVRENRAAEELFSDGELDILYRPEKYRVRFAIWDKLCEIVGKD